jgi:hypothetical protein
VPRKELGEILREADLITPAQLTEALTLQRTFGERLASVLVRQHILTEKFAVIISAASRRAPWTSKTEIELSLPTSSPRAVRAAFVSCRVEGPAQLAMADRSTGR